MKKRSLAFVAASLILSTAWYSCTKDSSSKSTPMVTGEKTLASDGVNSDGSVNIGYWHNTALTQYFQSYGTAGGNAPTHDQIRDRVIALLAKSNPSLFSSGEITAGKAQFDKLAIADSVGMTTKQGVSVDKLDIVMRYLLANKLISKALASELGKIHTMSMSGISVSELLATVDSLKTKQFASTDQKYISAFTSTYDSSYTYWTNRSKSALSTASVHSFGPVTDVAAPGPSCGDVVILADAAGALYGSILSPAFSIIEGAIFSVAADNQPPCSNGSAA